MITTNDLLHHDRCPRLRTLLNGADSRSRISLSDTLNISLKYGLTSIPSAAYQRFMSLSANPGLDLEGCNVYDIAVHHAQMLEVLTTYLTPEGPWKRSGSVTVGSTPFQPSSYIMPDGRLRRVVLCSSWNRQRRLEESLSWRTLADVVATGRPMLINAIIIGATASGFRSSPWTCGFIHPENGILRIKKKEGTFTGRWKKVYRESTDIRAMDWLTKMQQDNAFEGIVESFTIDVPENSAEILGDMKKILHDLSSPSLTPRRSGCFARTPCQFLSHCYPPSNLI